MANRKPAADRRQSQLLIRLTAQEYEVLDAAAHLSRQTPNAFAYELLRQHITALEQDDFVARHVDNRQRYEQSTKATILLADRARPTKDEAVSEERPSAS